MAAAAAQRAERERDEASGQRLARARAALLEAQRAVGLAVTHTTRAPTHGASDAPWRPARAPWRTGWRAVDRALGGGLPRGALVELVGPRSAGRLSAALALVEAALAQGREPVAFVDAVDALDPRALTAAARSRVLWARAPSATLALRALDLVLEGGGFSLAVLYLVGVARPARERAVSSSPREGAPARGDEPVLVRDAAAPPAALVYGGAPRGYAGGLRAQAASYAATWTRLAQRAEAARTTVLVVRDGDGAAAGLEPGPGSYARVRLEASRAPARWREGAWLEGRALRVRVTRAKGFAGAREASEADEAGVGDAGPRAADAAWLRAG